MISRILPVTAARAAATTVVKVHLSHMPTTQVAAAMMTVMMTTAGLKLTVTQ